MGLLTDYTGIGMSPRPKHLHQDYMLHIAHLMYDEILEQGLLVRTESTVTTDWNDLAPDIVVFADDLPVFILEITTHRECDEIISKCLELRKRFPGAEYFVFDYEQQLLYKYDCSKHLWLYDDANELRSKYLSHPMCYYVDLQN